MSYEIVRGIKIEKDKVLIKSSSNNVSPKDYRWDENGYFTDILKENGRTTCELAIFKCYESGTMQGGPKKYTDALRRLWHNPEYEQYDWRRGSWANSTERDARRASPEFEILLRKTLEARMPKDKFVIYKLYDNPFSNSNGKKFYLKACKRRGYWFESPKKATQFRWYAEAERIKKAFQNSDTWQIQKIA